MPSERLRSPLLRIRYDPRAKEHGLQGRIRDIERSLEPRVQSARTHVELMRDRSVIPMNLRIKPTLKAKLERLAKHDRRTLHAYVEKLLNDHVKRSPPAVKP